MNLFHQYLNSLIFAINQRDGVALKSLLSLENTNSKEAVFEKSSSWKLWKPSSELHNLASKVRENVDEWKTIISSQLLCLHFLCLGNPVAAYTELEQQVVPFTKIYREEKVAWLAGCLITLSKNLRGTALAADNFTKNSEGKLSILENCGGSLRKVFATAISGSVASKKAPVLEVVVCLFKIYFQLNTLRLCKNLIAAIEKQNFNIFPASSRVSYMFYVGRLSIFDDQYENAEAALEYALKHCHKSATQNISKIMYYLVPVKMLLGHLPTSKALNVYNLQIYQDTALQMGNLELMNNTLTKNQWTFICDGTFLILEKLKQTMYRRLLKKVYALKSEKGNQLKLVYFQQALNWEGVVHTMDEVECLIANLIYRNYVKGYISHSKHVLVCSKLNPFPNLSAVQLTDLL